MTYVQLHIMALFFTLVALLAAKSVTSSPLQRRQNPPGLNFNWGSEVIRGVNIGGWLILEPWVIRHIDVTSFWKLANRMV
jgi:hypothetical protein